ncbi:MAG: RsmD family RNA methyltransferase, partial [Oscillospiraceae bacterium]
DIAFLDPPYEKNMVNDALPLLVTKMRESGAIICETYKQEVLPKDVGDFSIFREYKYGKIKLTVYRRTSEEQN